MKLTKLEEIFRPVGLLLGGVFLLRSADALRFIEEHRTSGIPVLGIEGFHLFDDGTIQPDQLHSADFDAVTDDSHQEATRFIEERLSMDLWFEVVCGDR